MKKLAGTTFQRWKQQLVNLGYEVDHRELVAADYGTPTTRKRFYLIARCDGQPIVWPERTHAPRDSEEVKAGKLLPWRSAAEIIDWSIPGYSVFASKAEIKEKYGVNAVRPLAENTMRRIIRGVDKFTIRSGKPFLVECNHGGDGHARPVSDPVNTLTGEYTGGVCGPVMAPWTLTNTSGSVGASAGEPVGTVRTGGGGGQMLLAANLIQYHTEQTENVRANGLQAPIPTVDASNRYGLPAVNLVEYFGTGKPLNVEDPLHTVTSHDREGVVAAHIVEFKGQDIGQEPRRPLRTITASWGKFGACHAYLTKADGGDLGRWPEIRALLNKHCGYHLAEDEVLLLEIGGTLYFLSDITLRMLTPRELYNAMGFPPDYIIDRDYTGKPYGKSEQVARCGNAVCPPDGDGPGPGQPAGVVRTAGADDHERLRGGGDGVMNIQDLPPWAQAQAMKQITERKRKGDGKSPALPSPLPAEGESKYHSRREIRTTPAGKTVTFDSRKEARRYDALMALLAAGTIRDPEAPAGVYPPGGLHHHRGRAGTGHPVPGGLLL